MEMLKIELSAEKFDKAVHGGLDASTVLRECGDLQIFVKPNATVGGNPMAVITFTVETPDGKRCRAQATTTVAILLNTLSCLKGWTDGGHLNRENLN